MEVIEDKQLIKFLDLRNRRFVEDGRKAFYHPDEVMKNIAQQIGYLSLMSREERRRGIIFSLGALSVVLFVVCGLLLIIHWGAPEVNLFNKILSIDYALFTGLICCMLLFMLFILSLLIRFLKSPYGKVVAIYEDLLANGQIVIGEVESTKTTSDPATASMDIFYKFIPRESIEAVHRQYTVGRFENLSPKNKIYVVCSGVISIVL